MRFINLTGKKLKVVSSDGNDMMYIEPNNEFPAPYVKVSYKILETVDGIDICETKKSVVSFLPAPNEGVYYIVSKIVAEVARRTDLIVPDKILKNGDGVVLGCRCFSKVTF